MRGYFPGYDMEPCWFCGSSSCSGNHSGEAAERAGNQIVWQGEGSSARHNTAICPCQNCANVRSRRSNDRSD